MFTYPSLFLNLCYRTYFFSWIICRFIRSPYLCNVFFIVLDLRLTKVGARRCSFFYAYTLGFLKKNGIFVNHNTLKKHCHEKAHYPFLYKHT